MLENKEPIIKLYALVDENKIEIGWEIRNSLRKHTYSNILKISPLKTESFQIKILNFFLLMSAQNVDYGYSLEQPRQGSSNKYLQSMFLSRNKKYNVYPCKPQFYYIKVAWFRYVLGCECF